MSFDTMQRKLEGLLPEPEQLTRDQYNAIRDSDFVIEVIPTLIADAVFTISIEKKRKRELPTDSVANYGFLLDLVRTGIEACRATIQARLHSIAQGQHERYQKVLSRLLEFGNVDIEDAESSEIHGFNEEFQKLVYFTLSRKFLDEFPVNQ